jgi:hypothetical protein
VIENSSLAASTYSGRTRTLTTFSLGVWSPFSEPGLVRTEDRRYLLGNVQKMAVAVAHLDNLQLFRGEELAAQSFSVALDIAGERNHERRRWVRNSPCIRRSRPIVLDPPSGQGLGVGIGVVTYPLLVRLVPFHSCSLPGPVTQRAPGRRDGGTVGQ